jgi:hypothetical protein
MVLWPARALSEELAERFERVATLRPIWAVGEAQIVECVEQARDRCIGKAQHGEHAQMLLAELRLDATQEWAVAKDGIEVGWDR